MGMFLPKGPRKDAIENEFCHGMLVGILILLVERSNASTLTLIIANCKKNDMKQTRNYSMI